MADPEDLSPERPLAAGERDAVPVAEGPDELDRVDAVRRPDGGHDRGSILVRREELETHRLRTLAAGATEPDVALERGLETRVEDHPERDVQPRDERDGRRERRVEL